MKLNKNRIIDWLLWLVASKWRSRLPIAIIIMGIISGVATLFVLGGNILGKYNELIEILIKMDSVFLIFIMFFLVYRISRLMLSTNEEGEKGLSLQRRFAAVFGVLALVPAILITIFSLTFFELGIKSWFSERVSSALQESHQVASAYLREHRKAIIGDALSIAREIDSQFTNLSVNKKKLEQSLIVQGVLRNLTEGLIFDTLGNIYARYGLTAVLELEPLPLSVITRAKEGEAVIFTTEESMRVRALVKLNNFNDTYIIIGRFVDPKVIGHIKNTDTAISEYEALEDNREDLQFSFTLIFILVVMLLLAGAVWIGLSMASTLTNPIKTLMKATSLVRKGKYKTQVDATTGYDEIGMLMESFNQMTADLDSSTKSLHLANKNMLERNRFVETLLEGLRTGVIATNSKGIVILTNKSALTLLGLKSDNILQKNISDIVPEFNNVIEKAMKTKKRQESEAQFGEYINKKKMYVRIGVEKNDNKIQGFIISFDDISQLEITQKKAAWSDVARRVAHEIKNPLTPIQLSAERLKRRYKDVIPENDDVFNSCTDTIIRQVEEIGRLVDEFNSFARMPEPIMINANFIETVRKAYTLQKTSHSFVEYTIKSPRSLSFSHDVHQIGQMITNLMKNSFISLNNANIKSPKISVYISVISNDIVLSVEDNGNGFPAKGRKKLLEPYVTHEEKGTGLGLSIVKKVVEDHGGKITLEDSDTGGAKVNIVFKNKIK